MIRATRRNICNILGVHNKDLKMRKTKLENGYTIQGFLPRIALEDLMSNFHVYMNKNNQLVVITKGRLSISNKV